MIDAMTSLAFSMYSGKGIYALLLGSGISRAAEIPTASSQKGHQAIAKLAAKGYIRVIVTTNFDRLIEQALEAEGVFPTVISSVDAVRGAMPLQHATCTVLKVHGDYRDTRCRNTEEELKTYPPELDGLLDRIFDEYGLVVCGWSATWDHALRAAIQRAPNRRFTTAWASRGEPSQAALDLIRFRDARHVQMLWAFRNVSKDCFLKNCLCEEDCLGHISANRDQRPGLLWPGLHSPLDQSCPL
jgi:hypothetical protein